VAGPRARSARPAPPRSRHFLRPSVAAELVRDACVGDSELVVDIGAGTGRITEELSRAARQVVAVEIDPQLAAALRGRWPNVRVVEADVTTTPFPRERFRVVANIPFGRTNDILRALLDDPRTQLERADLVVEWGVAVKRGLPWPSTVSGVVRAATFEATVARRLPPGAFEPPPSVAAGVLVLRRRARPLVRPDELPAYARFVARGFRRGIPRIRGRTVLPRDLDAFQWAALFRTGGRSTYDRRT
jgi:23S rRNA (adenine-N6)-dimethyltransferase